MINSRLEQLLGFLKEEPEDPFTLYAIATEYLNTDSQKSLEYFNKLLKDHENYIGTYYHAGKLLEKLGDKAEAEKIYTKGLEMAQKQRKMHALAELRAAYNSLMGLDFEDE